MKKIIVIIGVVFVLLCLGITASAATVDSGVCGENISWSLDDNGLLTVSGAGDIMDFENTTDSPWSIHRNLAIKSIRISDGITGIGSYAFEQCGCATSVELPDSITKIGARAFMSCTNLKSILIPEAVESIGESAFAQCGKLETATIPGKISSIEENLFFGCKSLKEITIPDGVKAIGDSAFSWCDSIKSIDIPKSVENIDTMVFLGCGSLESVTVHKDNQFYASFDGVLYDKGFTKLIVFPKKKSGECVMPVGVKNLETRAFYGCSGLESIVISAGIESIKRDAFAFCSNLKSVTIPGSVKEIGDSAFLECSSLTDIYYGGSSEAWQSISMVGELDEMMMAEYKYGFDGATIHYNSPFISVKYNDDILEFDQNPIIENGRTLVPFRGICEAMDAVVEWNGDKQQASATLGDVKLIFTMNEAYVLVNGEEVEIDQPPVIRSDRVLLPVRAFAEKLGAAVDWDGDTQTVIINK